MSDRILQPGAARAWYLQLINCALVVVLLSAVPLLVRYEFGLKDLGGFGRWWLLNSLLIVAYLVERTRYDWLRLREVRRLGRELTAAEFKVRGANERLHRKALLAALVLVFFGMMLSHGEAQAFHMALLAVIVIFVVRSVLDAWTEFRKLNRTAVGSEIERPSSPAN